MKKLIEETAESALESLMGERITLYCCRYIYTGKLIGVAEDCVQLTDGGIVYDTGRADNAEWENYEKMPNDWYVARQSIESFGLYK
jgi:hypothetical protein